MTNYVNILPFQLKVPSKANPSEAVMFRTLLLNRCQREFQKDASDDEDMKKRQEEIDAATSVRFTYKYT